MRSGACPISLRRLNKTQHKIIGVMVWLILFTLLWTDSKALALFLVIDFALRLFRLPSFLSLFADVVIRLFGLKPLWIDEATRRFALFVGAFFVILVTVALFLHIQMLFYLVATIFLFCLFLELVFDFCVACKLSAILRLLR